MVSKPPYDQMAPQLCQFYVPGQPLVGDGGGDENPNFETSFEKTAAVFASAMQVPTSSKLERSSKKSSFKENLQKT